MGRGFLQLAFLSGIFFLERSKSLSLEVARIDSPTEQGGSQPQAGEMDGGRPGNVFFHQRPFHGGSKTGANRSRDLSRLVDKVNRHRSGAFREPQEWKRYSLKGDHYQSRWAEHERAFQPLLRSLVDADAFLI